MTFCNFLKPFRETLSEAVRFPLSEPGPGNPTSRKMHGSRLSHSLDTLSHDILSISIFIHSITICKIKYIEI